MVYVNEIRELPKKQPPETEKKKEKAKKKPRNGKGTQSDG